MDIIGIGAQKSATSWASFVLNRHPRIFIPSEHAYSYKEVGFFSSKKWDNGVDWYKSVMTPPTSGQLSLDVTPAYAKIGEERIRICHDLSPTARIFYLLRNPIERDWSSLLMEAKRKDYDVEAARFADLLELYRKKRIDEYSTYDVSLEKWRKFYSDDQILIGLYEDVRDDPAAVYKRLCAHVGVDPTRAKKWRQHVRREVFKGPGNAMPRKMYDYLFEKYQPMIERLGPLIGRDVSHWLREKPAFRD